MKTLLIVFCIALIIGFGMALVDLLNVAMNYPLPHLPFVIGIVVGGALFINHFRTLYVWFHETCHSIVSFLTFNGVHEIYISKHNGGYVRTNGVSNFIVTLAPYAIPLFSLIALSFRYVVMPAFHPSVDAAAGFLYGQHLVSAFKDTRTTQPDIQQHGLIFSLTVILCLNVICLCVVILLLSSPGLRAFTDLFLGGIQNAFKIFGLLISSVHGLIVTVFR